MVRLLTVLTGANFSSWFSRFPLVSTRSLIDIAPRRWWITVIGMAFGLPCPTKPSSRFRRLGSAKLLRRTWIGRPYQRATNCNFAHSLKSTSTRLVERWAQSDIGPSESPACIPNRCGRDRTLPWAAIFGTASCTTLCFEQSVRANPVDCLSQAHLPSRRIAWATSTNHYARLRRTSVAWSALEWANGAISNCRFPREFANRPVLPQWVHGKCCSTSRRSFHCATTTACRGQLVCRDTSRRDWHRLAGNCRRTPGGSRQISSRVLRETRRSLRVLWRDLDAHRPDSKRCRPICPATRNADTTRSRKRSASHDVPGTCGYRSVLWRGCPHWIPALKSEGGSDACSNSRVGAGWCWFRQRSQQMPLWE